jgi:hypothetical protein
MKGEFFMLKINLQLFGEESTGVESSVAAGQEMASQDTAQDTAQAMTDTQLTQGNSGVETRPAAGVDNGGVEKAFAARLARERERLEAEYRQRYETELKKHPHLSYLEEVARSSEMTVDQLIENDRKFREQQRLNELIQKNIPEEYAREMLENRKLREEYMAEKQAKEQGERQQKMYQEFFEAYPEFNDPKKANEIPAEVWKEVKQGRSLLDAYARYENKRLKDEMTKFQQQQQTQAANQKNAESSTGSVKSPGATGGYISREQFDANKHDIGWVLKNLKTIEESRKHWK